MIQASENESEELKSTLEQNEAAERPKPTERNQELASKAEMLFAGQYLNLAGVLLLIAGLASYLKSSGASSGFLESLLAAALGLVLLVTGEYLFRKDLRQYSQAVLAGGFCLLFFSACSAYFRHGLIEQGTLFALLLPVVICSNASVFRYDSKFIGNVMLVVYFFSPLFVTFQFESFSSVFLYLLAINLGSTLVAFYKKWDLQLLVSALGSYALYFHHFQNEQASQSLLLLFMIYGVSLVGNTLLYFVRPSCSNYNLVLSFINPTVFSAFSAVTILGLPNWARVTAYAGLTLVHGLIALMADKRRAENPNFMPLATSSLALTLLFASAAISFVTYFSDSTTYFGPVTLLWFAFALITLWSGFKLERHATVFCRFSYFGTLLAGAQVAYVLPAMEGSTPWRLVALGLYVAYFGTLLKRRKSLTAEQNSVLKFTGLMGGLLFAHTLWSLNLGYLGVLAFGALSVASLRLPLTSIPAFTWLPHGFALAALGLSVMERPAHPALSALVPALAVALAWATEKAVARGCQVEKIWLWVGLFSLRSIAFLFWPAFQLFVLGLALLHLGITAMRGRVNHAKTLNEIAGLSLVCLAVTLYTSDEVAALTMLASLLAVAGSFYLAWRKELSVENSELAVAGFVALRVAFKVLHPYALLGIALAGLCCAFMRKYTWREVVFMAQILFTGAVCFLPLQIPLSWALSGLVVTALGFLVPYFRSGQARVHPSTQLHASIGMAVFCFLKLTFALHLGTGSTVMWVALATWWLAYSVKHGLIQDWIEVGQGLFDYSRFVFFLAFVKSVWFDANFVRNLGPLHYPGALLVSLVFLASGHFLIKKREARNSFVILGLLSGSFQMTFLFHNNWGDRLLFQPLLSGFWSLTGFAMIALGIFATVKVYRLFGLTTLVGNTAKILWVDIHVLDSYSQVNTYLILGTLLMTTSFLYQRQRERLSGVQKVSPELAELSL